MADDTNPVPPKSQRLNVKSMNVTRQRVSDAQFTRADIETGEIKSLEGDILNDIKAAIDEQTESLGKGFKRAIDDCCKAIVKAGGAGGGGGSGDTGGVGSDAETKKTLNQILNAIRAQAGAVAAGGGEGVTSDSDIGAIASTRRMQAISRHIEEVGFQMDELGNVVGWKLLPEMKKFEEQLRENVNETVRKLNTAMLSTLNSFTKWDSFSDEAMRRWTKGLELASSGMGDFYTMFGEDTLKVLTLGMGDFGDSLQLTAQQIRELAADGTSPMRLVQGNVREVAREFKRLRGEAEEFGLDLYARVGFEEQNKLLTTLVDQQRRGSLQEDFRNFETRQTAMRQLDFLSMVADNTGQSLDALLEQSKEATKTFEELQALGIITQQEAAGFDKLAKAFPQQAEFLKQIAASGGDVGMFAAKFPDMYRDLQAMGATDLISGVAGIAARSDRLGDVEFANLFVEQMQGAFAGASQRFGSQAATMMFEGRPIQQLIGGVNQMAKMQENMGSRSVFVRTFNKFADFLSNNLPIAWAGAITALGFNTVAVIMNTIAHWKGMGIMSGLWGGIKGLGSALLRTMGFLGGAAAKVGMGAATTVGGYAALPGAVGAVGAGGAASAIGGGAAAAGTAGLMGKIGGALKGVGKIAGGVGTAALVGKDLYDVATGDTSGENIGALIGSAIGGIGGFFLGGPAGAMLGASLGNMAGEWVGSKFDTPGGAAKPNEPSYTPKHRGGAGGGPGGAQQAMMLHMMRQTDLLNAINRGIQKSISVQGDIASNIGNISSEQQKVAGRTKAGMTGAPLFAESPSMSSES